MHDELGKAYCYSILIIFSLLYFIITASTFTSLGVVLPSIIAELGWSWATAGLGFTLLGLSCGLSSYLPAYTIRKFGIRSTLILGGIILTLGFAALFSMQLIITYFLATILLGIGFSFVATVPGTFMLTRLFQKQPSVFGIYFFIGGLGGVIGPYIYFLAIDVWQSWRLHWIICNVFLIAILIIAILVVKENETEKAHAKRINLTSSDNNIVTGQTSPKIWTTRTALKTWQFYIIALSYSSFLLCGITVNSFAVTQMIDHGFSAAIAASLLSSQAFINAVSRISGGILGEWLNPKIMLIFSLSFLISGMLAISYPYSWPVLIIFIFGIGIGYGITFLSSSILLSRYFGREAYLELFSIMNLIATIASLGPLFAGILKDKLGSFTPAFLLYALLPFALVLIILFMSPPSYKKQ